MDSLQALHTFWSSFGWKAYDETSVPDEAELPRITYEVSQDYFNSTLAQTASLWIRATGWTSINEKAQEISDYIGRGGRMIPFDGGALWIRRGLPWAQRMSDEDDTIRRIVLNIEIEFIE